MPSNKERKAWRVVGERAREGQTKVREIPRETGSKLLLSKSKSKLGMWAENRSVLRNDGMLGALQEMRTT